MTTNTSVSLDEHFTWFLQEQVNSGRYKNVSEVIRAGLRMLEEHELQYAVLRNALQEGLESGPAEKFDFDSFVDDLKNK